MTQEEKARAYDDVVNKLRGYIEQGVDPLITTADVQDFFPELTEVEDERIRKELITHFRNTRCVTEEGAERVAKWITWLEKQESVREIVERCKNSWYNEGKIDGMAEGLTEDEKYQQGWHDALEKQGEQNPAWSEEDEKIRKALLCILKSDFEKETTICDITVGDIIVWLEKQGDQPKIEALRVEYERDRADDLAEWTEEDDLRLNETIYLAENHIQLNIWDISWLKSLRTCPRKKHDNQLPDYCVKSNCIDCDKYKPCADSKRLMQGLEINGKTAMECLTEKKQDNANCSSNVNSKFKVGDWIVDNRSENTFFLKSVNSGYCSLEDAKGNIYSPCLPFESDFHLWTILDAKDGDVLMCPKYAGDTIPNIFIFKDIKTKDNDVFCYCSFLETFRTGGYIANADPINTDFYPATKEQRDLLFQKMREAGYEWDAENKKLKKIDQKPVDKVEPKSQIIKDTWYICTYTTCSEDSRIWFKKDMVYLGNDILKYDLGFGPDDYQDYFRLWDILDAKDGDVLCYETKDEVRIFIYVGYGHTHYHCCYYNGHLTTIYSFFIVPKYLECYLHPATKEQRDLLFTKIKEAGYRWNADEKKLEKIVIDEGKAEMDYCFTKMMNGEKASPAWSEEDERMFRSLHNLIFVVRDSNCDSKRKKEFSDFVNSLKDRLLPNLQQEWSEEDENMYRMCVDAVEYYHNPEDESVIRDWLKSLKDRIAKCDKN